MATCIAPCFTAFLCVPAMQLLFGMAYGNQPFLALAWDSVRQVAFLMDSPVKLRAEGKYHSLGVYFQSLVTFFDTL